MRTTPPESPRFTNRLIEEKSPYLLQHAHNPVDWHPWNDEAFALAREQEKLIFLSIGYSTCHWCHVMAHESFEDEDVAEALGKNYIAIKVDREERPDIDQIYMEFCQRLTGRGGWPLTAVLTTDGMPVFAATYLPREPRPGYDGLIDLLERIATQARANSSELRHAGEQLLETMQSVAYRPSRPQAVEALFTSAASELHRSFDPRAGGFGNAPKFPTPHNLRFLIRRWQSEQQTELLQMAEETLIAMRRGGIFDHLGGGFHRYSTDSHWLLPHFEKMLYDQAGLADAYLDAWLTTGNEAYAETTSDILGYVCRELIDPCGAFHAAEDADSEGEEGLFYVWGKAEIEQLLEAESANLFCETYGIEAEGNYRDEVSRSRTGLNIPHLATPEEALTKRLRIDSGALHQQLARARQKLFTARQKRPRPHRDDKILCAWNGMIIGALARAGRFLEKPAYSDAAARAADFVLEEMRREDGRLLRRWRDGEAAILAFAEDYAFLIHGLLELYQNRFRTEDLQIALELAEDLYRLFAPENRGALFDSGSDAETLVTRPRTLYDGATPSANAVAIEVFTRLYLLTGETVWRERADEIVLHLAPLAEQMPSAFTGMLYAATLLYGSTRELVIVGDPEDEDTRALLETARAARQTDLSILLKDPQKHDLEHIAPFTADMCSLEETATAYLCNDQSCQQPTNNPEVLERQLRA